MSVCTSDCVPVISFKSLRAGVVVHAVLLLHLHRDHRSTNQSDVGCKIIYGRAANVRSSFLSLLKTHVPVTIKCIHRSHHTANYTNSPWTPFDEAEICCRRCWMFLIFCSLVLHTSPELVVSHQWLTLSSRRICSQGFKPRNKSPCFSAFSVTNQHFTCFYAAWRLQRSSGIHIRKV